MDTHSIDSKDEISNEITKTILKNSNIKEVNELILDNYGNGHFIGSAFVVLYDDTKSEDTLYNIENDIYRKLHVIVKLHLD